MTEGSAGLFATYMIAAEKLSLLRALLREPLEFYRDALEEGEVSVHALEELVPLLIDPKCLPKVLEILSE